MSGVAKKWTARDKSGKVVLVGCVSEISFHLGYDTPQVYAAIRNHYELAGLRFSEAKGDELNFQNDKKVEISTHTPVRYKDSHSQRFTPL